MTLTLKETLSNKSKLNTFDLCYLTKVIHRMKSIILSACLFLLVEQITICQVKQKSQGSQASKTTFNLSEFGAIPDGKTLNTKTIQKALDATSEANGTLVIPKGVFLTGTIFLKSNTHLELSTGAVLLGSPKIEAACV
jgi:hypothetical protein